MNETIIAKRIEEFNKSHPPFTIMNNEDGQYSLSIMLSFLKEEYKNYCQESFDNYTREREFDEDYTRGSGYDWEKAFHKAFENDPNIKLIEFDCESGGFYCNCQDLSILIDFGHRFKEICEDNAKFTPIVFAALDNEDEYDSNKQKWERTIYNRLLRHPLGRFDIRTPDGDFFVDAGMGRQLIEGNQPTITSSNGTATLDTEDFLAMKITEMQRDLLDRNHFQYLAEHNPEQTMSMKM